MTEKKNYKPEVKKLLQKSEVMRQCHSNLYSINTMWHRIIRCLLIVLSSTVAILTFASYTTFTFIFSELNAEIFSFSVGLLASFVFILTLVEEFLNFHKNSIFRKEAVNRYTNFINYTSQYKNEDGITEEEFDKVLELYQEANNESPLIPDRIFLENKRRLKEKIAISKLIDSGCTKTIRQMKMDVRKSGNDEK